MGGFGVLAWVAIGAVGGWVISRLMVTAGDDALRGTAAGMVGGILGGLAMRLLGVGAGLDVSRDRSLENEAQSFAAPMRAG